MSEERGQSPQLRLDEIVQQRYESAIIVRLVGWTTGYLKDASYGLRCLIFSGYLLAIQLGTWFLTAGHRTELITVFGFPLFYLVLLQVIDITLRWMIKVFATDIGPHVSAENTRKIEKKLLKRFPNARQIGWGLIALIPLYVASLTGLSESITLNSYFAIGSLINFVVLTLLVAAFLWSIPIFSIPQWLDEQEVTLYALDPGSSVLVKGFIAMASRLVWLVFIAFAMLAPLNYVSVSHVRASSSSLYLPAVATSLVWFVVLLVIFLQQQYHLSRLTAYRYSHTLNDIQSKINDLYERETSLSDEETERLGHLRELHADMTKTNPAAFDLGGALRFLSPVVIPVIVFVLRALNLPFGETITNLLEALR